MGGVATGGEERGANFGAYEVQGRLTYLYFYRCYYKTDGATFLNKFQ
jgi:hypothetical protein